MVKTGKSLSSLFIFFLLCYSLDSCQEKEAKPININELKASVIKGVGDTLKIVTTGNQTLFGCSILGTEITGTNEDYASISLYTLASPSGCITQTGTYNFLCKYYKNKSSEGSAVFSNYEPGEIKKGSITFSSITEDIWEGSFSVVCQCEFQTNCVYGKDSVVIVGTFKANSF